MEDYRIPKQLFYGELECGKRPNHKPRKRYKDVVKGNLRELGIEITRWEEIAEDRESWRRYVYAGCENFEVLRVEHATIKRALRKREDTEDFDLDPAYSCGICGRVCLSKAGLKSHGTTHAGHELGAREGGGRSPTRLSCRICGKLCRLGGAMWNHMRTHSHAIVS